MDCPRCGRNIDIPFKELSAMAAAGVVLSQDAIKKEQQQEDSSKPLVYKRKGTGWESVTCSCGRLNQISPKFSGSRITCNDCRRKINIVS